MTGKTSALFEFYRAEFGERPENILSAFRSDLAAFCDGYGFDWSKIAGEIGALTFGKDRKFDRQRYGNGKRVNDGALWVGLRRSPSGDIAYPFVTIRNFKLLGDGSESWSGMAELTRLYRDRKGIVRKDAGAWLAKQDARRQADAKRAAARIAQEAREQAEKQAEHERYAALYDNARADAAAVAAFPYVVNKKIGRAVAATSARLCVDTGAPFSHARNGLPFIAIPMTDVYGERRGFQRIYSGKDKAQTVAVRDQQYVGAFSTFGDLNSAELVYVVEGWATGASVFLAGVEDDKQIAVVAAISAGNIEAVVDAFKRARPEIIEKLVIACDNDQWKPKAGNTGFSKALQASKAFGVKVVYPRFDGVFTPDMLANMAGPTDFNDLHDLAGVSVVAKQIRPRGDNRLRAEKDPFKFALQLLQHASYKMAPKLAEAAALAGMSQCPIRYSTDEVLAAVIAAAPVGAQIDRRRLRRRIVRIGMWKMQKAQALRGFTAEGLQRENVHYQTIAGVENSHGSRDLPDHVANMVRGLNGMVIVRAPMGSGKTKKLIAPLLAIEPLRRERLRLRDRLVRGSLAPVAVTAAINAMPIADLPTGLSRSGALRALRSGHPTLLQSVIQIARLSQPGARLDAWRTLLRLVATAAVAVERGAYFAHRVSLIGDVSRKLQLHHYDDVRADQVSGIGAIACCINSITHPKFGGFFADLDTLCIDEAGQTLRHIAIGTVDNREAVIERLATAMRSAKRVILCDADANDALIDFCARVCPGMPIHVIEMSTDCRDKQVRHASLDQVFTAAIELSKAGTRLIVADDNAEHARQLADAIRTAAPERRVLLVEQETRPDQDVQTFQSDPNGQAVNYDVLIYSPAITSGVSIERAHFDQAIGFYHGIVPPADFVQMLRRDRTQSSFVIGVGHVDAKHETSREALWTGFLRADDLANGSLELVETDTEVRLRREKTLFDDVRITSIAETNAARNDAANYLLLSLHADGYKVVRVDADEGAELYGVKSREDAKERVRQKMLARIFGAQTPDEDRYDSLRRKELPTREESAELVRFEIEHLLTLPVDEDAIDFHRDGGLKKAGAFELLTISAAEARRFDAGQQRAGVSKSRRRFAGPRRARLLRLLELLGIDRVTGDGEFDAKAAREAMSELLATPADIALHNSLSIGAWINPKQPPRDATKFAASVLERLGLKLEQRKSNGRRLYRIDGASWALMAGICAARHARKLSAWGLFVEGGNASNGAAPAAVSAPAAGPAGQGRSPSLYRPDPTICPDPDTGFTDPHQPTGDHAETTLSDGDPGVSPWETESPWW